MLENRGDEISHQMISLKQVFPLHKILNNTNLYIILRFSYVDLANVKKPTTFKVVTLSITK